MSYSLFRKLFPKLVVGILVAAALGWPTGPALAAGVPVLCYHDVGASPQKNNSYLITRDRLESHFRYLQDHGYHPISLRQFADAVEGRGTLPDKPVLLTFDDGYLSSYTEVYPLLQKYQYPAVFAVVGSWIASGYSVDGLKIVSWAQLQEMEKSGLVTVASHSNALHYYLPANPTDTRPALTTLRYGNGDYEKPEKYLDRIAGDMAAAQEMFKQGLGHPVTTLVWPYGEYNKFAIALAKAHGFRAMLSLDQGLNPMDAGNLENIRRSLVLADCDTGELEKLLTTGEVTNEPLRVAQVDLDLLFDPVPDYFDANLNAATDYLTRSRVNTVFLQGFVDSEGTGNPMTMYFSSRLAPAKSDALGHAIQQLRGSGLRVFVWMPTLANQWLLKDHPEDEVLAYDPRGKGWYRRASPFSPRVRQELKEFFRDLAARNDFDGVLFQDDAYLTDYEDFSPAARAAFQARFGRELTPEAIRDPAVKEAWMKFKTEALDELTRELMAEVRWYRPRAKFARNIYALPVTNPESEAWFAQNYRSYLDLYDYTVIMAYPRMEKVENPEEWLGSLARMALAVPGAKDKAIFKLQAFDWNSRSWIAQRELAKNLRVLKANGAYHIAYYPVNAVAAMGRSLPF